MRTVALCSARSAPGVTTTALLLASCLDEAVLVEADLAGGVLAVRYGLGREPGLVTLAAANPQDPGGWREHAQNAGGAPVLVGPDSAATADSLWRTGGDRIVSVLGRSDGWAVVDAGRVLRRERIVESAGMVLVLTAPTAEGLVATTHTITALKASGRGGVRVVLVGDGPYRTSDVSASLGAPVLAHLPDDPATALALRDGGSQRSLAKSHLRRAVAGVAEMIQASVAPPLRPVTGG